MSSEAAMAFLGIVFDLVIRLSGSSPISSGVSCLSRGTRYLSCITGIVIRKSESQSNDVVVNCIDAELMGDWHPSGAPLIDDWAPHESYQGCKSARGTDPHRALLCGGALPAQS